MLVLNRAQYSSVVLASFAFGIFLPFIALQKIFLRCVLAIPVLVLMGCLLFPLLINMIFYSIIIILMVLGKRSVQMDQDVPFSL